MRRHLTILCAVVLALIAGAGIAWAVATPSQSGETTATFEYYSKANTETLVAPTQEIDVYISCNGSDLALHAGMMLDGLIVSDPVIQVSRVDAQEFLVHLEYQYSWTRISTTYLTCQDVS